MRCIASPAICYHFKEHVLFPNFVPAVEPCLNVYSFVFIMFFMFSSDLYVCPHVNYIYLSMALQPLWTLAAFSVSYSIYGRTPWTGDQPVARPIPKQGTTHTQNKLTQTSMPWVGFEPTITASELAKTVHALGHVATVISCKLYLPNNHLDYFEE
jgi:hypothetical protein